MKNGFDTWDWSLQRREFVLFPPAAVSDLQLADLAKVFNAQGIDVQQATYSALLITFESEARTNEELSGIIRQTIADWTLKEAHDE